MVNCRLMGGEDWREMTLWQYQAMKHEWNHRHDPAPPPPTISVDRMRAAMERSIN